MAQTAAWTQEKVLEAARSLPRPVRAAAAHIAAFLCGLLLSSGRLGEAAPFGLGFLAGVPAGYLFSAGAGAAAGYLLTLDSVSALRYVAALLSAGVLARLFREFERLQGFSLTAPCTAAGVCLLTGLAALAATGVSPAAVGSLLAESAAAFACAWAFAGLFSAVRAALPGGAVSIRELWKALLAVFLLLLSIADAALLGVAVSRVAAVWLVLVAAQLLQAPGGAAAGGLAAFAFLLDPALGLSALSFGAAGLAAGFAAGEKRVRAGAAGFLALCAGLLLTGGGLAQAAEALLGTGLFLLTPSALLRTAERRISLRPVPKKQPPETRAVLSRLSGAVHAVDEMAQSVKSVSALLETTADRGAAVTVRVYEAVCADCGRHELCWGRARRETLGEFDAARRTLSCGEALTPKTLPAGLSSRCIKATSLCEAFTSQYIRATERTAAQMKINEVRRVTAEQFDSLCDMLRAFSAELGAELRFDETAAKRAETVLRERFGCPAEEVQCTCSADDRLHMRLVFADAKAVPPKKELQAALEAAAGRSLEPPVLQPQEEGLCVTFCERTAFCVEVGTARRAADAQKRCGDSFETFYDGCGGFVAVLSDGMGQGARAAVDSTLTVTLFAKLCKAGVRFDSALRLVNAALMLKSAEESLATLDVVRFDLYTGEAAFYKAGAAKSLVFHAGVCREVRRASLPAGILREVRFAEDRETLQSGDLVVLASDGVFDADKGKLTRSLPALREKPCPAAAERLLELAAKPGAHRRDDMTVLVFRLRRSRKK